MRRPVRWVCLFCPVKCTGGLASAERSGAQPGTSYREHSHLRTSVTVCAFAGWRGSLK